MRIVLRQKWNENFNKNDSVHTVRRVAARKLFFKETNECVLIKKAGFNKKKGRTGAIKLIQRFGSSLNLNFHMLFLDGIYIDDKNHRPRFISITQPKTEDIFHLIHKISLRIGKYLERNGLIERDAENSYPNEDILPDNDMGEHQSHSTNYKIAIGPQKGKKVFRLKTIEPRIEEISSDLVCKLSSFSLHAEHPIAGIDIKL